MPGENNNGRQRLMRRKFLVGISGFVVTGCLGGNGDGNGDDGNETDGEPQITEGLGPVPEEYEGATSVGGLERRSSDQLLSYEDSNYQSSPSDDQRCDGCTYWIPDKNDDGLGACAIVANEIEPDGWCSRYAPQN